MKRKTLSIMLCILTCLALIGVGFAAWIITKPDQGEATGNVQAYGVTDERYELTVTTTGAQNIIFGTDSTGLADDATIWLKSDGIDNQSLEAVFEFTIKKGGTLTNDVLSNIEIEIKVDDNHKEAYDAAILNEALIKELTHKVEKVEGDNSDGKYKVTITTGWGTAFKAEGSEEAVNPYVYYNNQTYTDELAEEADANLSIISKLNGMSITVTIKVK